VSIFTTFADNKNPKSKSTKFRKRRFDLFIALLGITKGTKILDVGGTEDIWLNTGFENNVTIINIKIPPKKLDKFTYFTIDACKMDLFADNQFEIAFSNSVIEHVGDYEKQKMFAREIQRVSQKYWVQTPYKHFPIEPHFLFPLFQYFPANIKNFVGLNWPYSHLKKNNEDILDEVSRLRLLTCNEMQNLFPNSHLIKEKYFGVTKSLIVYRT